jgi:hypothetical protein
LFKALNATLGGCFLEWKVGSRWLAFSLQRYWTSVAVLVGVGGKKGGRDIQQLPFWGGVIWTRVEIAYNGLGGFVQTIID